MVASSSSLSSLPCSLFSGKQSWTQKLSEHTYLPGLQLKTFWSTHPPEPGVENHTRKSTTWCWTVEALKSPFPGSSTVSSSRARRSSTCSSSKEKHRTVWSRGFKHMGTEISSVLYFLQRVSQVTQAAQSEFKPPLSSLPLSPYFSSQDHAHNDGRVWVKSVIYIKVA